MPFGPETVPEFVSGHPFLDFVNTVRDPGKTRDLDRFVDGEGLAALLRQAGFGKGAAAPVGAQLLSLRQFREASYGVLSALAAGRRPDREDVLAVELAVKSAIADAALGLGDTGPGWLPGPLGGLQDELALSLAAFLQSDALDRLRECRRCTRLFLDHGRGPGRRWCSMETCGNRAKAQAFRARRRRVAR
jgi:predicted RNA-binding Zn ribbon-like protein